MGGADRRDATVLLLAAGGLLSTTVVTHLGRWLAAVAALARSPLVPVLAGSALAGFVALLLTRQFTIRRALARRVRFVLVPADSFDPAPEAVARFASALVHSRRLLAFDAPACAVRVQLDTDANGRLRYVVELPAHARAALRTAASAYGAVELRATDPDEPRSPRGDVSVLRAELVLARGSVEPLRAAGLDPDPLAGFARALGGLRPELGDDGRVLVDLLPLAPARRRRLRRRLLRAARREHHDATDPLAGPLDLDGSGRGRAAPAELVERRAGQRALTSKLGSPEPLFEIQVLLRVRSTSRGRAKLAINGLLAAFDAWAGENHFRASGLRLPGGAVFLGSNTPGRRRRFDRRAGTGRFAPARRRVVTATEIAGLLKPPTVNCGAPNVLRSGGVIPPPPPGLPTFDGQPGLLPLGRVATDDGERMVGVPLDGTFFSYMAGRSRYGKTETALGQFVHLARAGHGCFFLDPHEDGIQRVKRYLAREGVRERVVEINLAAHRETQPGWNLFAVHGRSAARAQEQVDAVVDAFASALRWDETNTRALNLTTQAAQALVDLARHLPPELAPTIFQIPALLGNDEWREGVLPRVSPATRQFFTERFPRLPAEAITPVTNLIDRLRVAPQVAALLGAPTCSYDVRAAMDRGLIVLACPGSGSARDRLIANFMVYDLLHAAKTRAELAPDRRRPFFAFFDEVQTYDGASSGNLAALLEQTAKYGVRAFLFNQNPERLTPQTWNAVSTNRSHLASTTLNAKGAALLARELGGIEPAVITRLARYSYLTSVTLAGEATPPFLVHGTALEDLYPDAHERDQRPALEAAIDRRIARRPVTETLADLDEHDRRIREHLRGPRRRSRGQAGSHDLKTGARR